MQERSGGHCGGARRVLRWKAWSSRRGRATRDAFADGRRNSRSALCSSFSFRDPTPRSLPRISTSFAHPSLSPRLASCVCARHAPPDDSAPSCSRCRVRSRLVERSFSAFRTASLPTISSRPSCPQPASSWAPASASQLAASSAWCLSFSTRASHLRQTTPRRPTPEADESLQMRWRARLRLAPERSEFKGEYPSLSSPFFLARLLLLKPASGRWRELVPTLGRFGAHL